MDFVWSLQYVTEEPPIIRTSASRSATAEDSTGRRGGGSFCLPPWCTLFKTIGQEESCAIEQEPFL